MALADVQEHALDILPDGPAANAALRRLRVSLVELPPQEQLAQDIRNVLFLVDAYLLQLAEGRAGDTLVDAHDAALASVQDLLLSTGWASENDD